MANNEFGKGSAKFEIKELLKGEHSPAIIDLSWSSEVHDQKITKKGNRVLVLKKRDGKSYIGTQYGRSYWELTEMSNNQVNCKQYTPYLYPINTVIIKDKYLTKLEDNSITIKKSEMICLESVKQAIKEIQ